MKLKNIGVKKMKYSIEINEVFKGVIKDQEGNIICTMYGKDKEMIKTFLEWEVNNGDK